jgi:D-amino-acid oxidase
VIREAVASPRAIVLGCGVSGLSCALRLQETGFAVAVWAADLPPHTTSDVAGAIWYPYRIGPTAAVARWARATYHELVALAREPDSGVVIRRGLELLPIGAPDEAAAYRGTTRALRTVPPAQVPAGFARAFDLELPVIAMPRYLAYLLGRFGRAGGVVEERRVARLEEALDAAPLVVNATGLGARALVDDRSLEPIRGQVVRVERSGVDRFVLDDYGPRGVRYVLPRIDDCVLGGTAEAGEESLVVDDAATRAIVERCAELEPRLRGARVLSVAVGLRPGRPTVRLERERRGDRTIIHDYGHGGAGVTVSWGCADDVLALARG